MEPAEKGQVPRQGYASRPSVSLLTPYGPRRFKGPFGSPLFAPTLTLRRPLRARAPTGSDAFAAAPYCGGSYLTPAKWQMCGGSCSQKPRTRVRTGGAVSCRRGGIRHQCSGFHKRVARPLRPAAAGSLSSAKNSSGSSRPRSPASRDWYWRAARCALGTAIGPGSKFRPDRCRRLLRPLKRGTHLASLARQPYKRAHRGTGACTRYATPVPAPAKKRKGQVPFQGIASRPSD
jgi:hypothetical protein